MKNYNELLRRFAWSLLLLLIAEVGKNIPLPGFLFITEQIHSQSIFERFLATTTGGQLTFPTLFSLGMSPYMTGLIIWMTITMIDTERLTQLSQKKRSFYQKLLMLVIAILQAIALTFRFQPFVDTMKLPFANAWQLFAFHTLCLVTGSLLLAWLADINCERGIGAQTLFILPGLLSNLPGMLTTGQSERQVFTPQLLVGLAVLTVIFVSVTLFLYKAEYRIHIQRTGIDTRFNRSYLPIRLLTAGAMPFMFAITVFSVPQLVLLSDYWENTWLATIVTQFFSFGTLAGIFTYGLVIFLLGIGFSFINVRPYDIAKNLQKSGDYIFEVMPGKATERYISKKIWRIATVGNSYLVLVSVIPLLIGLKFSFVTNLAFYFGSLFMVIIILDTLIKEIQFLYFKGQYALF